MNEILKIVYDKSKTNKLLNTKDLADIVEYYINSQQLDDYVLNLHIGYLDSKTLATYSLEKRDIVINLKLLKQCSNARCEEGYLGLYGFFVYFYKNLFILHALFHELEHANQLKTAYNDISTEGLLIRLSLLVGKEYYDKLYPISPEERLADIKAFEKIIRLIKEQKANFKIISDLLEVEKQDCILVGYSCDGKTVNDPITNYFSLGNRKDLLESFDFKHIKQIHNVYERMKYGFPVSKEEFINSDLYIQEINESLTRVKH